MRIWAALAALGTATGVLAQEHIPITGIQVDPDAGGVPVRRSINELFAEGGAQWDLYVRALTEMHNADYEQPRSYFQISGIHGKPYIDWNGSSEATNSGWQGFCPHSQVLVDTAKRIADTYPQQYRPEYTTAARDLRVPFWDWASETYVPEATIYDTIRINVPDDQSIREVEVANPLFTFNFPQEVLDGQYGDFDSEQRPNMRRCVAPDSYPDSANDNLNDRPYRSWVYDAFTRAEDFSSFASTGDSGISLEQIHNGIHWDAGCGGQFLDASFSAFDPLFMLHHANVDRLWAYWQAIHPDEDIFQDTYEGGSRYGTPQGTPISPDSPLEPFFQADGTFHTTISVRSIQGFGYTYPELEYWSKSEDQLREDARSLINRLYGGNGDSAKKNKREAPADETRYFASIQLDVTEVERPCLIDVYIADVKAGGLVLMVQPETGVVHGDIPLDDALKATGKRRMGRDATVDSIQDLLSVNIAKRDGTKISPESIPSLQVEIEDVEVKPATTEHDFPSYGTPRRRPAVSLSLKLDLSLGLDIS